MATVKFQLRQLSRGKRTNAQVSPLRALLLEQFKIARRTRVYKRLMASLG
ncbi:MAG: 2,4-dienoyl-CoA reductase, partial [Gammaproteobacteria bacterium HGW-Gammaproteobacteria-7]